MRTKIKLITANIVVMLLLTISFITIAKPNDTLGIDANSNSPAKIVVLVRHAEKRDDGTRNPVLSEAGQQRAKALIEALQQLELSQLIASNYQRTQLTLDPIANQRKLPVIIADSQFGLDAHIASIVTLVNQTSGNSLIAGHSNTVPLIIKALGGPKIPAIEESQYASLYLLSIPKEGAVSLIQTHFGN
ncbi:histidine phosphatase family protein [Shewanella schlegeliana]|uniref:Histidine phosphatase family protein n=1 Tax=Shewanella schlegeliana TaxID=190308 RepID=A0ABS1SVK8_9GAMM|nr:histidine phosphatase family protein [Shewanella schlegeliana]MBL4912370.1 histidine phosphatase family protein [Shewanella schlegeliana]MCL1108161.1 histidine phosphatase family protein [Shewanella schlegeliana]GIU22020.1 hypothetical protein TUM4433_02190 [Shewanella schlegeliana]